MQMLSNIRALSAALVLPQIGKWHVDYWHFSTVPNYQTNVCFWEYNEHVEDIRSFLTQSGHTSACLLWWLEGELAKAKT